VGRVLGVVQANHEREVEVPAGGVTLAGTLTVPTSAEAVVVFAHGSGSGRFSPRNRAVADVLVDASLATLLIDLLTEEEEAEDVGTAHMRFDVVQPSQQNILSPGLGFGLDQPIEKLPSIYENRAALCRSSHFRAVW